MKIGTRKGDKVQYGGAEMRVVAARDLNTLVLISAEGEYFNASIKDLEAEASAKVQPRSTIDPKRAAKVSAYLAALGPLLGKDRNTKAAVAEAADKLGISTSSAYEAIKRFRETGETDHLPPPTRSGGRGKARINANAQKIIDEVLEATVLKRGGAKPRKFFREVKRRLEKAGFQVAQSTLAERLKKIPEHRWAKARKGYNETRKTHDPIIDHYPEVHRPLEVVQIDHWKADIEILSDDRLQVIGRVWITLAIDVYSRMVFGMHVGIDAPSTTTFGMAMINGMTRKDSLAVKYELEWDNPMGGKPERLEADNAGEFTGRSAQASCEHFNIRMKWRPLGQPQYGAHIERLNGNLAVRFKDLPGATGATPAERKELRPEATAAFTLEDVTKHAWMIVDEYHNDVHTGIGMSPLEKFRSYYFGPHGQKHRLPDVYIDNLEFRIHWFPFLPRTIQRYGIRIDYLDYYSETLKWLVRNRKTYKSVDVRRHPFDVRVIYIRHPDRNAEDPEAKNDSDWIPVHLRQLNFPEASIHELKAARREAARRKRAPTPELLGRLIDEQHRHIEEAVKKTKTAQREATRRSHHTRIRKETAVQTEESGIVVRLKTTSALEPSSSSQAPATTTENHQRVSAEGSITSILAGISDDDVEAIFE